MKRILTPLAILGLLAAGLTGQGQVTIPAGFAAPPGSVDTSKPGFSVRLKQSATGIATTVAAREAHLVDASPNVAFLGDDTYLKIGDDVWVLPVLNCNVGTDVWVSPPTAASAGNIVPDDHFPGIPNETLSTVQFTCEITGYLHLTAGAHRLVFNSDDGFRMTMGVGLNNRDLFARQIGIFDGGRGPANSDMDIVVEADGYYAFRIVYFQGGGGGSMELTRFVDGRYVLVNGADPAAPRVYYEATGAALPYATATYPAQNSVNQQQQPELWVDVAGTIDSSKSALSINGTELSPVTTAPAGANTRISARVPAPLAAGSVNTAEVTYGTAAGYSITHSWQFTVGPVVALPPSYREPGTPGAAGFAARIHLADAVNAEGNNVTLPNTTVRAEEQVRGFLVNPATGSPYVNAATLSTTTVPGFINMNVNANSGDPATADQNGNFNRGNGYQDQGYPGLPGTTAATGVRQVENFSIEFVGYLNLPAGPVTLGVNSDDGFIVKSGPNPRDINARVLGVFEGGRGSANTDFHLFVEEAGLYSVRLLQYQGGGGGNVEFYSMRPDGSRGLINDTVAGSIPAHQTVSGIAPRITVDRLVPFPNSIGNPKTSVIEARLSDAPGTTVTQPSIVLQVNGAAVTPTITKAGAVTTIIYDPPGDLPLGATMQCALTFTDSASAAYSVEWSFEVSGEVRMRIFGGTNLEPTDPIAGGAVVNLTSSAQFRENRPAINQIVSSWEINPWNRDDNYGSEFLGYFMPKTTDWYTFYLSSDDGSQLWLSTDDSPANARVIASQASWNGRLAWITGNNPATRRSAEIYLEAGQSYFIRTLHKEGGGGDNLEVTYRTRTNPAIANGAPAMSSELRPFNGVGFSPVPLGGTVQQARPWTFNAGVVVGPTGPITYQWLKNGTPIAGATEPSYAIASAALADSGDYVLRVTVGTAGSFESPPATLTVSADTDPPVLISGGFLPGSGAVGLRFNEPVNIASATFTATGATVSSAQVMEFAPTIVQVNITGTPAAGFQITANNVRDLVGNTLTTATVTGEVSDLSRGDVGAPAEAGSSLALGNGGYYIAGGGSDIWGNADQFHYVYKQFTGPFDMRARVDSLVWGDEWAKATLMARQTLDAGSRNQAVLITKSGPFPVEGETAGSGPFRHGGVNVYNHQWRNAADGVSESKAGAERISPTVFPSWIRLVRETTDNNTMRSFISYDGDTWIPYHTHTTAGDTLPATLYLGMAVTSHDNAADFLRAEAVYGGFSIAAFTPDAPTITTQPQPSVSVNVGETVSLLVVADGTGPFTYQWTKGGVDIAGVTASSLIISNAQESDSGTYAVRVTGPGGPVTSNNSVVTVGQVVIPDNPVVEAPVIVDGEISITWSGGGEVETAEKIEGPWEPTGNTSGSFSEPTGDGNRYYRINRGE